MDVRTRNRTIACGLSAAVACVGVLGVLYLYNRAPINRIDRVLRECDSVTLRFVYGGVVDPPRPIPIQLTERQDIDSLRKTMALADAYTSFVPMARGANPRIDVIVEKGGRTTAQCEINGNLVLVLDHKGHVKTTIVLRSLKAYWHLLDVEEREKTAGRNRAN